MEQFDVVVIGAGAAGMFCAAHAGNSVAACCCSTTAKPGRKILMSGGGRCNFTNMYAEPAAYLSNNPHFCKSALARYTQWDFIDLINRYGIAYHEKRWGSCSATTRRSRWWICWSKSASWAVTMRLRSEVLGVENRTWLRTGAEW